MKIQLLAVVVMGMLFSGCAFKNQKIAVEYTPDNVKGSEQGIVCLNKFSDVRTDKSRIGIVKNGYGMETANILTDQDITIVVSKSLEEELSNLGYKVELLNIRNADGQNNAINCAFVDGKIQNFFVEPEFGLFAVDGISIITVELMIQTEDGMQLKKVYSANGNSRSYIGGFASLFKESMDNALKNLILDIKKDLPLVIKG